MKKGDRKFCPKCGFQAKRDDVYCIRCGYNFIKRGKKMDLKTIIIIILIILTSWVLIRIFLKKPIISPEIINIIKNLTLLKRG